MIVSEYDASNINLLFQIMDSETVVTIIECLLRESNIVFSSICISILTPIIEVLTGLLSPFQWE